MTTRTHIKTDMASLPSSFLLLVMVAGVLNMDLFAGDGISGYKGHNVRVLVELVLKENDFLQSPVLSISRNITGSDVVEDPILLSHFQATCFGATFFITQNIGHVNTRPLYCSGNYTRSSNIPHQNSDEDEAFILSPDVA